MPEIIDERTLAGYLIGPTEHRFLLSDGSALIRYADVEEHVKNAETGTTKRCDLTLRGRDRALVSAELKRPEVMDVKDQRLQADAHDKAVRRGMDYFLTCNMRQVAIWETKQGARQREPKYVHDLARDLTHSSFAQLRRSEIAENWKNFLDAIEPLIRAVLEKGAGHKRPLPAAAVELRDVLHGTAQEAAARIRAAVKHDDSFKRLVLDEFRAQFGVELFLDPDAGTDLFLAETEQVALISSFVVATRLVLYQALSNEGREDDGGFPLDPLDVTVTSTDPARIARDIASAMTHARSRTHDFETALAPSALDDIVFVDAGEAEDVGKRWGAVVRVVKSHDWSGPAAYVPGLYESLLDDEHRHVMGVHYTPDSVAEVVVAYGVTDPADVVLDPAAGAGTFVTMAYERKRALGSTHDQSLTETYGVEIADFAASLSAVSLTLADKHARSAYPRVIKSDFFKRRAGEATELVLPTVGAVGMPAQFDAVLGNPPYIRFENRTPEERHEIHAVLSRHFRDLGISYPNFTGKADLWAFFIAHAHTFLCEGGRLGFVLSWNLLATNYGDAVLAFLGRYFIVDAIIDSKAERWFAAKQNTLLLLARKAPMPDGRSRLPNPHVPADHLVRFVRLKQPLERLLDEDQPRGKRAEDLVYEWLHLTEDSGADLRWDVRLVRQADLVERTAERDIDLDPADADEPADVA